MNADLTALAAELATTDRTLRRAVAQGLLRAERPSPRKLELSVEERVYLRQSWPLLAELRRAFRTEPAVAFAALFGSAARGELRAGSDIDLLVELRTDADKRELASRLSDRVGIHVQIVSLADARRAPLLLAEVLSEGRVLVDRERLWARVQAQRARVERAAARERDRVEREFADLFAA